MRGGAVDTMRPWWRGLDYEVRLALEAWDPARDPDLQTLEATLRERLPLAELTRPEGASLCVAWDGVGGRREVRVLVEPELVHESDFARVLGRVVSQRAPGRTVLVALHGLERSDLALDLALGLLGDDPVLDGSARVVDLRIRARLRGATSRPACAASG